MGGNSSCLVWVSSLSEPRAKIEVQMAYLGGDPRKHGDSGEMIRQRDGNQ